MKKMTVKTVLFAGLLVFPLIANAQYKDEAALKETKGVQLRNEKAAIDSAAVLIEQMEVSKRDTTHVLKEPLVITLEQALDIALSENVAVKVAGLEIKRTEYAKKGAYAALYPQIDLSASYQRTIKKQKMYMNMGGSPMEIEVGMFNTLNAGATAVLPLVNAQLWKGLKISAIDVELAVEKARSSKLEMVTQVKNAYYGVLFAKEALKVYEEVYDNALKNYEEVLKKFEAEKVSEFEEIRAKTSWKNAIPNMYNAASSVELALWQLKAVLGVDLDFKLDVKGNLGDFTEHMFYETHKNDTIDLANNSTIKQLKYQVEQLKENIKLQKYACIPSLAASFNFSYISMANDVSFKEFPWSPYSTAGISLSIPIFAGGKRHQAIRQAKNQHQQVQLQVDNTKRQLEIAVRQHIITMETNMESYYAAQEAVKSAEKAYEIAVAAFNVGRSTQTDLNDAQLALTQSQLAQSQAVYNFLMAKSQLEHTLGQDYFSNSDLTNEK